MECSERPYTSVYSNVSIGGVVPVFEKHETALLLLLGFGGMSLCLAIMHRAIRKYVFHDEHNVDTAFDAGGQVSTSLTAVTVASQLLWPGDLLQSATITVKSGISGPFWYTVGAALNIALFPVFSVHLKTRAPGAKTFLQIIYARFGKPAHLVFCILALLVNAISIATLLVAGVAIIQSLTTNASNEFSVLIIATLFGCYSFVGGLGTTFYVSYFNAVLIFSALVALLVKILYTPDNELEGVGSLEEIYNRLSCLQGPEGNEDRNFLTFRSENGITFAVMGLCLTTSLTYCDQASWQSRIAAKPLQGVIGFLMATYMWFAIPSSIAATTGLAYLSMSTGNTTEMLTLKEVDEGLVTPFIAEQLLGPAGGILVLTMVAMALMSTGSGEVMAVSSIIVYDIYQVYIKPFRSHVSPGQCLLCAQPSRPDMLPSQKDNEEEDMPFCRCPPVSRCLACKVNQASTSHTSTASEAKEDKEIKYTCGYHGDYHRFQDKLFRYKSWCILWVTIAMVPFGLMVKASGIDLNWTMLFGFIVTIPAFPGVALSIFYSKTTGAGLITGAVAGVIGGVSIALGLASTYENGLDDFLVNTVQNVPVLAGCGTSVGVSVIVTLVVSLFTTNIKRSVDVDKEWRKLRNIDNPLHPWAEMYREDFPNLPEGQKPSLDALDKMFKKARIAAYVGGGVTLLFFVVVIPAAMLSLHVLELGQFKVWVTLLQALCFTMAAVVIIVAPAEEILQIYRKHRMNKTVHI